MKRLLLSCLVLAWALPAWAQREVTTVSTIERRADFTGNANGPCWEVPVGVAYHSIRIEVDGPTAGNIKLQGSMESDCSSPADIIADQDMTMVTAVNGTAGVYQRVQLVASGFMGSGTVRVFYMGDKSSSSVGSAVTVTSGTVTANLGATDNAVLDDIANGIAVTNAGTFATQADTELAAAAAAADGTANPTVPGTLAFLMAWNGTTWDRVAETADPCSGGAKTYVPVNISTATTVELANAVASQHFYICSVNLVTAAANNVVIAADDTDGCGSITAGLFGGTTAASGWNFGANGGIALGNGNGTVLKTATVNHYLCILTSAATQLSGTVSFVQAP